MNKIPSNITVDEYIKKYLDPKIKSLPDMTFDDMAKEIINPPCEYEELIEQKIHTLTYAEFLQTLYWRVIAAYKRKLEGYKCEVCGSTKNLNVHHRTYIIHGVEHDSEVIEKDLMLLCGKCHQEVHSKIIN